MRRRGWRSDRVAEQKMRWQSGYESRQEVVKGLVEGR